MENIWPCLVKVAISVANSLTSNLGDLLFWQIRNHSNWTIGQGRPCCGALILNHAVLSCGAEKTELS